MDLKKSIDTTALYHAYVFDSADVDFASLQTFLRDAHDDVELHVRDFETLGIQDSRDLVQLASMRSVGRQVFVCRAQTCTTEAQNALLKLFEEPPAHTHFFLCVPNAQALLPTLRSRVWYVASDASVTAARGETFVRANATERADMLAEIIEKKDKEAALALLSEIEQALYARKDQAHNALMHLIETRRVLFDTGASLKILLESVAVTTPQLS